jgi:hypothetical protein
MMSETSAEQYRGHLISFIVPNPNRHLPSDDPWIGWIGEVISVYSSVFHLAPCDFNHPHNRLCVETQWFDIRNVDDARIVGVVSPRTAA